jgi:hypothetical protein
MMTTEEALEYLNQQKGATENNPQGNEQEPATETADSQPATAEGGESENPDNPPSGANAGGEVGSGTNGGTPESSEHLAAGEEGEPDPEKDEKQKLQERYAKSFRKEKDKRKRQNQQFQAEIARLKRENAELKGKLGSDDFKADKDSISALVKMQTNENEISRLQTEQANNQMADDMAENERRVNLCFPDETDRKIYAQLLQNSGTAFVEKLDAADPEGVILGCLDDCEISPIVLRVLMTRPAFLNDILSKKTRHGKEVAFDALVNQCKVADKIIRSKQKKTPTAGNEQKAGTRAGLQTIKPTGRQAKGESGGSGKVVKNDAYWNQYLSEHPRGR